MCRWGCSTTNTSYMCKWCGTRYCKECLRGEFVGEMTDPTKCRKCNQTRCQGPRVDYVPRPKTEDDKNARGKSAPAGRSRSPAKSARAKSAKPKSAKSGKKSGKKSAKKKKKK